MAWRYDRNIPRPDFELAPICHRDMELAGSLVREMGRLAEFCPCNRLYMILPLPAGLELVSSYGASANLDDLNPTFLEGPGVIWRLQALLLDVCHIDLLSGFQPI